jgi:O-antigen/teichoic acid export membrane protein
MAAIISHEDMNIYTYVSIVETALKLGVVFLLRLIQWDKLTLYGILLCAVTLVSTAIYRTICVIKYQECKARFYWNKKLFKEIAGYTGWSLFGSIAWVVRNQGVNIVLNIFFGPLINAARGIASQVNAVVSSFGTNFSTSVYPQIIKSNAVDDKRYVWDLTIQSSKLCYFLFLVLSMPLLLETEFVLKVWLTIIPEYTVVFTRLILIDALVVSFTYVLGAVNQATGNIKIYQLVIGVFLVLNLPVAIVFFMLGFGPASAMIISIGFSASALVMRLIILKVQMNFPVLMYLKKVLMVAGIVTISSMLIPLILYFSMPSTIIRFLMICSTGVLCCCAVIYFIGLSKGEQLSIQKTIQHRIKNNKFFR